MTESKEIWIKTGYEIFALSGQSGLKIEPLAKKVGKSKSSFYHHFAGCEFIIKELPKYHIYQFYVICWERKNAKTINPDHINIIVVWKNL